MTGTPFSYTFFSSMSPNTQIAPHYGAGNIKLRCHFPLFVPKENEKAYLRVGSETCHWKEGEMLMFDDTYEHEAGNLSSENRVILLIDIWHPDLHVQEREAIKGMFHEVEEMVAKRQSEGNS